MTWMHGATEYDVWDEDGEPVVLAGAGGRPVSHSYGLSQIHDLLAEYRLHAVHAPFGVVGEFRRMGKSTLFVRLREVAHKPPRLGLSARADGLHEAWRSTRV
jgi:hypothetical protein